MKRTAWYPANVRPTRDGVYEVKFTEVEILFSKWIDGEWKSNNPCKEYAEMASSRSFFAYNDTRMKWRGLASNPKKVKK